MMSPSNLTRLLDLAEVRLHLGQLKETEDTLNTARVLDKDLTREKELRIQLDLEKENFKKAEILMAELESGESITSFMNNKAISLVRNGRFEHGIEFYQKSLLAMPENWKEWRAIVQYNLALAYVRYSECDKAYDILKQVNEPQLSIYRKARGLVAKIERFRKTGEPIFKDNDQDLQEETVSKKNERAPSQQEFDFSKIIEDLEAKKGDVCCHQIYFCLEGHDERCTNTLKNMPSFKTKIKSIKTA
jgi:tetratricopeptide (TPR) repeat protein